MAELTPDVVGTDWIDELSDEACAEIFWLYVDPPDDFLKAHPPALLGQAMRYALRIIARGAAVLALCLGGSAAAASAQERTAFANVSVVPMDGDTVLPGQTVLVEGGRITVVGPTSAVTFPMGTRIIDGTGRFLLPGLADMHMHLAGDSTELLLHLANGVTTVRDLAGDDRALAWRAAIAAGTMTGPRLYVSTPILNQSLTRRAKAWRWGCTLVLGLVLLLPWVRWRWRITSAGARRLAWPVAAAVALAGGYVATRTLVPMPDALIRGGRVSRWWIGSTLEAAYAAGPAARGYDAVKLYGDLSGAQFRQAVRAARATGHHTVAHVPKRLGLMAAIDAGLEELAHVYFVVEDLQHSGDSAALYRPEPDATNLGRLRVIAAQLKQAGVVVTPTLMPMPEVLAIFARDSATWSPEVMQYRSPSARAMFDAGLRRGMTPAALADIRMHVAWGNRATTALWLAGVPLVLGTDANPFDVVAGFAVHAELAMYVACGLTPWEALRTATVNAATLMGAGEEWGTVAAGRAADLVLADANPLADVAALRRPRGVMRAGRWYDRAGLDSLLETVARRRAATPN